MVKTLHYCWFGGAPLPESAIRCMESWKKFCPGYEIKRWDESNFDVTSPPFVAEAYAAKKWAFVSDYVRTYALYHEGGLYVDTDVEFVKGVDDLTNESFIGFEGPSVVNPGLILHAAAPHEELFCEVMDEYAKMNFSAENMNDITSPIVYTRVLEKRGFRMDNTLQSRGGFTVYPMEYFQPMGSGRRKIRLTENTRSVHHYDASWFGAQDKKYLAYRKKFGERAGRIFYTFVHPVLAFKRKKASDRNKKGGRAQ